MRHASAVLGTAVMLGGAVAGQALPQAKVSVAAGLVAEQLQVRPVPLHELRLVRVEDTALVLSFRTRLDGKVTVRVAPGHYRLQSASPVRLLDKDYRWDVSVSAVNGRVTEVELTNINAIVDSTKQVTRDVPAVDSLLSLDSLKHMEARLFARYDTLRQRKQDENVRHMDVRLFARYDTAHQRKQDENGVLDSLHQVQILLGRAEAAARAEATAHQPKCPERWEYKNVENPNSYAWTEYDLNSLAHQGWEVVSTHEEVKTVLLFGEVPFTVYTLKRRITCSQ